MIPSRRTSPITVGMHVRTVFVASKSRTRKNTKKQDKPLERWAQQDSKRSQEIKEEDYKRKLKEIRQMTTKVSKMIKKKEDEQKQAAYVAEIPLPSDMNKEVDTLYKSLEEPKSFDTSMATLLTPVVDIPESINQRLGLSVKYLVSRDHQNWPMVLQTLSMGGGFEGLDRKDITTFVQNIPRNELQAVIPQIQMMMKEAKITPPVNVLNCFINALSCGNQIPPQNLEAIETFAKAVSKITKGNIPITTVENMITVYGKMGDLDKMNDMLLQIKDLGLKPTPFVYTSVLKSLVYKSNNHKEAVSIFDSMKFLSQETKPGTNAYKDVMVSYVNNNNVEKALDLYQEMLTSRTPINQEILVALAKGCSNRKELRFKAWEFMFEIYDNNWTPTIETYEYMIYLASKDGDLALARALYKKLSQLHVVSKRSFTFLLMAYSKVKAFKDGTELPVITLNEKGRNLRSNLLSEVTSELSPDIKLNVPFLPVMDLTKLEEVMAESKAIWTHSVLFNPEFINIESYNSYLNVAATFGNFQDLQERYAISQLPDDAPGIRVIEDEENTKLSSIESKLKISRTTMTYIIALKGAGRLRQYEFSQEIWMERGKYRQSSDFKSLNVKDKKVLDFQFANQMVQSLTNMNLLDDAMAIIISTEYQFKWSWAQLTNLYKSCVEVGNHKLCSTLRSIASRAQVKFEGKIRRKDFKEYVMRSRL